MRKFLSNTLLFNLATEDGLCASAWRGFLGLAMLVIGFGLNCALHDADSQIRLTALWCATPVLVFMATMFVWIRPMLRIGATRRTIPASDIERIF